MVQGFDMQWLQILLSIGVTILLGLVVAIWIMLKERIQMVREELCRQIGDTNKHLEREIKRVDCEIDKLRKTSHNLAERTSAVETYIRHFVMLRDVKDIGGRNSYNARDNRGQDADLV